jgi:hypothetical protein
MGLQEKFIKNGKHNVFIFNVAYLLKTKAVKPVEKIVSGRRLCKQARCWATIEDLLETVIVMRSVTRLYNEDQLARPRSNCTVNYRPVLSSERALQNNKHGTV